MGLIKAQQIDLKKVYLSGGIYPSDKIATEQWRMIAAESLNSKGFITIDPCRNKLVYEYGVYTPKEITARDHADINAADLILLNGNPLGNHLSIGTWCEMERAHNQGKPIVVFSQDPRVVHHPWVLDYAARIFPTAEEAVAYIETFWT